MSRVSGSMPPQGPSLSTPAKNGRFSRIPSSHQGNTIVAACSCGLVALAIIGGLIGGGITLLASGAAAGAAGKIAGGIVMITFGTAPLVSSSIFWKKI